MTKIEMPQGMAYGWWQFPEPLLQDLAFVVEFAAGDEVSPGRYFQLYQGKIGDFGMYFGFLTEISDSSRNLRGKGLIFSRWETRDYADAEASPGGWVESAGYEGDFVGLRLLHEWKRGQYICFLRPKREEAAATWYEFSFRHMAEKEELSVGSLRFPHVDSQRPLIHSGGGSWTEVYKGAEYADKVPTTDFHVHSVRANNNHLSPVCCVTAYNTNFPCADAEVTPSGGLRLRSGFGVAQTHPAGQYSLIKGA